MVDVARLLLMVPMEPWQNSTPFFGTATFCRTKIDDFRASLMSTSLTTLLTYSSKKRSLRWNSSKKQIIEAIEVDQLAEKDNERLSTAMSHLGLQSNEIELNQIKFN